MKKALGAVVVMVVTVLVVACGGGGNAGGGSRTDVHMGQTNFTQASITISKGSSLNLQPGAEPGAPTVNNLQFSTANQSQTIGPFTTAGTFHLYCVVHPGMNLIVTVQ